MSRVLITRPLRDALPLQAVLKSKGFDSLVAPVYESHFFPLLPLESPQALIITSKNALRSIENDQDLKNIPLYGVGDETTRLAQEMGFIRTFNASGTGQDVIKLIIETADPKKGTLYHLSGDVIKVDFIKELAPKGFQVKRQIVYTMKESSHFPITVIDGFRYQNITHVMFFSSRTAKTFANLLQKSGLDHQTSSMVALCLSNNIAEAIHTLRWKTIWVSKLPNENNMIEYFNGNKK